MLPAGMPKDRAVILCINLALLLDGEMQGCVTLAKDCLTLAAQASMSATAVAAVASLAAGPGTSNTESMDTDISMVASHAQEVTAAADARALQYRADAERLYQHVGRRMDAATARVLQVGALHMQHFQVNNASMANLWVLTSLSQKRYTTQCARSASPVSRCNDTDLEHLNMSGAQTSLLHAVLGSAC